MVVNSATKYKYMQFNDENIKMNDYEIFFTHAFILLKETRLHGCKCFWRAHFLNVLLIFI